ncbi:MAG: sulfatase-like hydrolase/transferase [Chloroflexota bacterium]
MRAIHPPSARSARRARHAGAGALAAAAIAVVLVALAGAGGPVRAVPPPPGGLPSLLPAGPSPTPVPSPEPTPPPGPGELSGSRPDIVLVLLDDVARIDERVWERLPTIRRLFLRDGIRFSDYIGNDPLCCPGRAALLTGQRTRHHGVVRNFARNFDARTTFATELKRTGYHTIYSGKYFNETEAIRDKTPSGWAHSLLFSGSYFGTRYWRDGRSRWAGRERDDYTTDLLGRQALRWLRSAPAEKPVLLTIAPFAAHAGLDATGVSPGYYQPVPAPRHRGDRRCAGIRAWGPPSFNEADVSDKPAYIRAMWPVPFGGGWPLTLTCESLLSVDELLADLIDLLAREGREDVLFILTADNGMGWGMHRWTDKRVPYAIDLPLYLAWPSRFPDGAPRIRTTAVNMDIAPTLCDLAGCEMGPFRNRKPVSGTSLLPLLETPGSTLDRVAIPVEHWTSRGQPPWRGVRTTDASPLGRWLYVTYRTGEREMYDLARDPWLLENLAGRTAGDRTLERVERRLERLTRTAGR